jgi:hypothetical protein
VFLACWRIRLVQIEAEYVSFVVMDDFFWCDTICKVCEIHIHTNILTTYDTLEVCVLHTPIPTLPPMTCIVPMMLMSFVLDKAIELRRLDMVL